MKVRDVQAVITASGYVRHGRPLGGSSFRACTCPKVGCGGVVSGSERDDCPEHHREPVQLWHWSAECPQVLAGARAAIRRGLAVFPLAIGSRVPEPGWQRQATLDETLLPELLAGQGVGIGCRASQVVTLDLDVHGDDDGPGVLGALADRLGAAVPETFTVATPSGGAAPVLPGAGRLHDPAGGPLWGPGSTSAGRAGAAAATS